METIGSRLRAFRKSTRLSQKAFSELAGASQSTINRFENNQADIPHTVLLWYEDYFDVSADYLLCRTDNPQGKLYECKPVYNEDNEELKLFIEMCFDPESSMNKRLKQSLIKMVEEGKK